MVLPLQMKEALTLPMRSHFSPIADRFTLCGSAVAALVSFLTRRLVFRGSAVYISTDGLALSPSAVAERSLHLTSDQNIFNVQCLTFLPTVMLTIYRWGWDCWII